MGLGASQPSQFSKYCECCGREFYKNPRDSYSQWDSRQYCSISCNNKSRETKSPLHIRFWSYVDRKGGNECWEWKGTLDNHGYGKLSRGVFASPVFAHRLGWELFNGQIPKGMNACHKCDNPKCVNPSHIFIGSQKENMRDCSAKNRLNASSLNNLRPGTPGHHGAGPKSNQELRHEQRN